MSFLSIPYATRSYDKKPYIPIRIWNPRDTISERFDVLALIDSGSDICLLPYSLGSKMMHDNGAKGVHRSQAQGVHGCADTFLHTFIAEGLFIDGHDTRIPIFTTPEIQLYVQDHKAPNPCPVLLGMDFISEYIDNINYTDRTVTFKF